MDAIGIAMSNLAGTPVVCISLHAGCVTSELCSDRLNMGDLHDWHDQLVLVPCIFLRYRSSAIFRHNYCICDMFPWSFTFLRVKKIKSIRTQAGA